MNFKEKQVIRFKDSYTFHLKDDINHILFWWPNTLLTYSVEFSLDPLNEQELALFDAMTGDQVPFQLSRIHYDDVGNMITADVSFMTDLGPGEERRFILRKEKPQQFPEAVKVTKEGEGWWIDNGNFAVQIPLSQIYPTNIPGPIMKVRTNGVTYGNSFIDQGRLKIVEIRTYCQDRGPLFTQFTVKYMFDEGKTYEVTLKLTKDMDFVDFIENIDDIEEHDNVSFQLNWSGLGPTHRHAPNNPVEMKERDGAYFDITARNQPKVDEYERLNWQRMDEPYVAGYTHPLNIWSNQADGEIPFRLSLFEPQAAIVRVNSATFWNEVSGQSVGAFITDAAEWNNYRYDLFSSWDGFAISFYYKNGLMWWKYPVIKGRRSTAIAVYQHAKDKRYYESVRPDLEPSQRQMAGGAGIKFSGSSYCLFLQNRYGLLSLDTIKDYVLNYPEDARRPQVCFDDSSRLSNFQTCEEFEQFLINYILVSKLPTHGQRENAGFSPVPYRRMTKVFAPAYNEMKDQMPFEMRKRIEAILLLLTYLAASEQMAPLFHMYAGPPNLHGDVKRSLGYFATLFPDHPEAEHWKKVFSKFVETSLRVCTRPELPGLRLMGGRWAENLGTYTWAFLIPSLKTNILLEKYSEGNNLFANQYAAMMGRWLLHSLTAPFDGEEAENFELMDHAHYWGCFVKGTGPHRVYLPIGAHAARRTTPKSMRDFATHLEKYDPILAENIHYICSNHPDDFEDRKGGIMTPLTEKERLVKGTRPDFKTTAFTGYGIMLRSGVFTSSEVSVFVQQLDEGPNYRWGTAAAGGNGNIYYYAGGKAYSHNGLEDAGDRRLNDCEVGCNFGVWKNNKFTSIGQNVITNGYHALGTFQYTSIEPEKDHLSYSYPEYLERNVLLSGTDYISIYDKTSPRVAHRFTWSVSGSDNMPNIYILSKVNYTSRLMTGNAANPIHSVWYEGRGDCFAVVSHRDDLHVEGIDQGAIVSSSHFRDTLFRNHETIAGEFDGIYFAGTVGAVRRNLDGTVEMALLEGHFIQYDGIKLGSENGKTGLGIIKNADGEMKGYISTLTDDRITITFEENEEFKLFIDSAPCKQDRDGMFFIPAGEYNFELVSINSQPTPEQVVISQVVQGNECCEVIVLSTNGADRYQVQASSDYCETWHTISETDSRDSRIRIEGLINGKKYFIRVRAVNEKGYGPFSHEYPVYPTSRRAEAPEGLDVIITEDQLHFTWGQVLGAHSYTLYKKNSKGEVCVIYKGNKTDYSSQRGKFNEIHSYIVSATNLCGEGEPCSHEINDDPTAISNYKPMVERGFQRNSLYCHHPFRYQSPHKFREVPSSYPDSMIKPLTNK